MHRHLVLVASALALVLPAAASAQTQTQTDRDREREKIQEARERAQEARERELERRERERDRELERRERERDSAGSLDTVVTFDARGSVTVSCPGGAVVVTTSDRNELRVRARTERGTIRFTSSGAHAALEPANGRGCNDGRFEVIVPAGARVTASTWSGSIDVRGVEGDVEAHAMSGDVSLRDIGGRLDVESLSGDVQIDGVKGDANVHTVSGDVTMHRARGTIVDVESVSGDLQLRDLATRQVRTNTTSGDLTFSGAIMDAGRYEFETHSGEVRLELPADVGAQLSLSTFNGSIDSAFPITLKAGEHGMGVTSTRRLEFALGQGSARIIADTFSGDITLTSAGHRR